MQAFDIASSTLNVLTDFVLRLHLSGDAFLKYLIYKPCWSIELVEYIALTSGRPAREAYSAVAKLFESCNSVDEKCVSRVLTVFGLSVHDMLNIIKNKPVEISVKKMRGLDSKKIELPSRMLASLSRSAPQSF
jgi:argininosuccinate lyase